jgi:two-component system, NarL family, sensor histidine kinase DegS
MAEETVELTPAEQLAEFIEEIQDAYRDVERELREINMLVDQSRGEVDKLAQRNSTIASHLRQLQSNLEAVPRADLKTAYDAAADAQQRLFTMRGQLEKLQSEQTSLQRLLDQITKTREVLESLPLAGRSSGGEDGQEGSQPPIVRIINAQEAERRRLSRAMHDGPAQSLTNFVLQAEIVQRLFENDPDRCRAELSNLKTAATATFSKVREFIAELRPMMLDDLGLMPTVRRYVTSFNEKSGITTQLAITGEERRLEPYREVTAFRAVQELMTNARQHSQASDLKVNLDIDENRVRIVVEDNGKGFDAKPIFGQGAKTVGLPSLKERVEALGGELDLDSDPGQGTRVSLEIPTGTVSVFT